MKKYFLPVVFFSLIISGCASKTVLPTADQFAVLQHKTITFTNKTKPLEPVIMTPTRAIANSAMVGFLDSIALSLMDDNKTYKVKKVPSLYLNTGLIRQFVKNYDMKYIENNTSMDSDSIDELIARYPGVDYILDNEIKFWNVQYFAMHWKTYTINLIDEMRLIDVANHKVIAQKTCKYLPEYEENMPSYEEMMADNGALIAKETKKALMYCVEDLSDFLFSEIGNKK